MARKRSRSKKKKEKIMVSLRSIIIFSLIISIVIIITLNGVLEIESIPTWAKIGETVTDYIEGENSAENLPAEGILEVHYIDVGQGNSILIRTSEKSLLMDGGDNDMGEEVVEYLLNEGVTTIDLMIATHPHADHIGGLDVVIESIPTNRVIMPELSVSNEPETVTYQDFITSVEDNNTLTTYAEVGKKYDLGAGAILTIIGPNGEFNDLNDMSIISRLDFGDSSFIFTGDAEKGAEAAAIATRIDLEADVLALGHHGSATSSSEEFLAEVQPKISVALCGADNEYGHPHEEVVERALAYGEIFRSDLFGDIVITTDGVSIDLTTEHGSELSIAA